VNNSKNNYLPFLLLFIQPIFMASNLVIARGGTEFVPPISLAFWRWLMCFLILLPFTFNYFFKNYKSYKNELSKTFFLGFLACGICGAFPFIAGKTTTIVNMGIIYSSSPIFIILISTIFFKEKINLVRILGVLICVFGVLAIIVKGDIKLLFLLKFTSGDLWMLGASIGWAFYTIYLFNWKSVMPILERFTIIAMFGAISLLPFFILENIYITETTYDLNFLFWVLFAAISPSIIAFLLFNYVNKKLGASITGSVLYLYTVYGAIYGLIFFNETIELYHYIGTVLVFIGIFLIKKKINYDKKI
jgi:drug/metabolite transporter (DMT)-like permease